MATLTRAYATLIVKSVDEDKRIIAGIATSPEPDRLGDIIDPLGVTFAASLPLLLHHDVTLPVGTAKFDKPTKQGITFTAKLPTISEPGRLRDRVDEAWQSVKAGLIRGVSIGFRVIGDAIERLKDGGLRYLETEVLELSLVTVPANAAATITSIRSYDVASPAAPGRAGDVAAHPSGATDSGRNHAMNVSEKLTGRKAELKAKTERLETILRSAEDAVLSDDLKAERATLAGEVKELTAEVESLEALEAAQAAQAAPVHKAATFEPRETPAGHVQVDPPKLPPGTEFTRLMICKMASAIERRKGNEVSALEVARQRYPDNPRIQMVLKAAVAGATTTDGAPAGPGWAGPLAVAQTIYTEFVEFLRPQTIVGKFGQSGIPSLRRVPFNVRILGQSTGGAGYWVGEAHPKPLTKFDFTAVTLGFAKVANIAVYSQELARFSNPSAESLIRDGLAAALIARMDIDFVDPAKAVDVGVSPASITNGIAALVSTGTTAADVRADLAQLFAAFIAANITPTSGVFIMSEMTALALSLMMNALGQPEFPTITMRGGTLLGLPVITSQYCVSGSPADYMVILVNAQDIFLSDDGQVSVEASGEASLQMDDDPQGSPATSGGTMVSLWQTNQIGLRAERFINWVRRRDAAVAWIDHVAWGAGSP